MIKQKKTMNSCLGRHMNGFDVSVKTLLFLLINKKYMKRQKVIIFQHLNKINVGR